MPVRPEIQEIAERYEITIHIVPEYLVEPVTLKSVPSDIETGFGNGLHIGRREVYLYGGNNIESHLHEMMHIVTHPTGCVVDYVRENWLLMQVEREVARTMLHPRDFRRVVGWQQFTRVSDDMDLYDSRSPRSYWLLDDIWKDGYALAKTVGLLGPEGRPTFQYPTWPRDPIDMYFEWATNNDVRLPIKTKEELRA